MDIIVDSGSTKTHLHITNYIEQNQDIYIPGINPFYQTEEEIKFTLESKLAGKFDFDSIDNVYYYGAGCSFPERKKIVENAIEYLIPNAKIIIENDLLAACRALYGKKSGIACILGTGSNSCLYDGDKIVKNVSPLGYILGDEGSGATMGKILVSNILKELLPADLIQDFYKEMNTSAPEIMSYVYNRTFPNRYLASMVPFICKHIDRQEIKDIVTENFENFYRRNILQYKTNCTDISYIGSIAFQFEKILQEISEKYKFHIKKILKEPMDGLIEFHKNYHC